MRASAMERQLQHDLIHELDQSQEATLAKLRPGSKTSVAPSGQLSELEFVVGMIGVLGGEMCGEPLEWCGSILAGSRYD